MRFTKRIFFCYLASIVIAVLAYSISRAITPPRDPDTLYTTYIASIRSLDPCQIYDVSTSVIGGHVYETLYNFKYGGKSDEIFPQVAAELPTISPDQLTYTIPLRRGIRFFDPKHAVWPDGVGNELKASDVVFSWKRFADTHMAASAYSSFFEGNIVGLDEFRAYTSSVPEGSVDYSRPVAGLAALDDYTVQIKLTHPVPQFTIMLTATPTSVASEKSVRKLGKLSEVSIGTGPYGISEYLNDQRVVMVANPIYRGQPDVDGPTGALLPPEHRVPTIKRIQWDYISDALPAWYLFLQGRYDEMTIPKEAFADAIIPGPEPRPVPALAKKGIKLYIRNDLGSAFVQFNMTDPMLGKNKPLRQAMSLAFDRETFVKVYLSGRGTPATGMFPPDAPLFDPKYCGKWNHFDLAAAKSKLAEAEKINGGLFPTLHIVMPDVDTTERQYGEFFKSQMAQIGLLVEPECVTYDRYLERCDEKNYQIVWTGWAPDYPDERTYLALYDARLVKPPGSNSSGYVDAQFQDLFIKAEAMQRSPARDALYLKMRDIIDDDLPSFGLYFQLIYTLRFGWEGNIKDPLFNNMFDAYRTLDARVRRQALLGT